jgi:glycosyltransferase involved in cell wall biosynthesis
MNLATAAFALAGFQALMVCRNLRLYVPPKPLNEGEEFDRGLSVLIPARNEETNLPALLESLAKQTRCRFEVIVLDDNSTDRTLEVAREYADHDPRFQVHSSKPLPEGWAGKQHACHQLSNLASFDQWLFLDADVVLTNPEALARIGFHIDRSPAAMASSIPRQLTGTWAEQMVIPLIHLVLLGFLPFWEMRRNRLPALGAACGQMVAVKREAYQACGGHFAVRHRLHDAAALAAHMRKEGHLTDLFDSTAMADCRMYRSAKDVFLGFAKNATEGMARPFLLPIWTFLLLGANVLPWVLALTGVQDPKVVFAQCLNLLVYLLLMRKYDQTAFGVLTRPAGVLLFVTIQWLALIGKWIGWKASWKGRVYDRIYE